MGRIIGGKGGNATIVYSVGEAGYFGNDLNPFTKASCGSGGGGGASDNSGGTGGAAG